MALSILNKTQSYRQQVAEGMKAAKGYYWNGSPTQGARWLASSPRSGYDYASEVGDVTTNATAAICIAWMQRALTEVPFQVVDVNEDGEENKVPNHPLTELMNRPAKHWTRRRLMSAVIHDLMGGGNSYLFKAREGGVGKPGELTWFHRHSIKAVPDSLNFIKYYERWVNGRREEIDPENIVHLRFGVNPWASWEGITPWFYLNTYFSTDNQASIFSEAILRNGGGIAGAVAPKDPATILDEGVMRVIKASLDGQIKGHNAGSWPVLQGGMELLKMGFSPEEMTLDKLQTYPQDMICAAIGLSTLLLDLPSGKDTRTYANKAEAREAAVEQNVIPSLAQICDEMDVQLLPEFDEDPNRHCSFDLSRMRILQPDIDKQFERQTKAVGGPWMTRNEARALTNLPPVEGGDVLYEKGRMAGGREEADELRELTANGNGSGRN